MNNLDRKEAELRLAEMEKQIEELRAMINKPDSEPSLITVSDKFYVLYGRGISGTFRASECHISDGLSEIDSLAAIFETEEQGNAYGVAIATLAELRRQPGTITPFDRGAGDDDKNWVIIPELSDDDRVSTVRVVYWNTKVNAMACISPVFRSRELAEAAIARIGPATLAQMFKTFHHDE